MFTLVDTLPVDFASITAPRFVTGDHIEYTREEMRMNEPAVLRDIPLVLAIALVFATLFVALYLVADIVCIVVIPRVRFSAKTG